MADTEKQGGLVLHVEDDPACAASVALLLRSAGFSVVSAADGEEALAQIAAQSLQPSVLIVDFHLPGEMDGSEVAEEVARRLGRPIATILLSGDLSATSPPWLPGVPLWPMRKPVAPETLCKAVTVFAEVQRWLEADQSTSRGTLARSPQSNS